MTSRPRRWLILGLAPLIAAVTLTAAPSAAIADPNGTVAGSSSDSSSTADEQDGDALSGNATLNEVLDSTNRKYVQAKAAVAKSTAQQKLLDAQIAAAQLKRDALAPEVGAIAAQQYQRRQPQRGRASCSASNGSDDFLKKAVSLDEINALHDHKLRDAQPGDRRCRQRKGSARRGGQVAAGEPAGDAEAEAGGRQGARAGRRRKPHQGFVLAKSPVAAPAPRNAEGGFSAERCTVRRPDHRRLHHAAHAAPLPGGEEGGLQSLRRLPPQRRAVRASEGPGLRLVPAEERLLGRPQRRHEELRQQPDGVPGAQRRPARHLLRHLVRADLVPGDRLARVPRA